MIVQHYVPITYNNVSEMLNDTLLKDGMVAQTLGYYSPGDDGGGTYKITNISEFESTMYVANLGTVLNMTNDASLKAILIVDPNSPINVAQFGAKGDGVNDDYLPIKQCIDNFDNIVFGRNKDYIISAPITNLYQKNIDLNFSSISIMTKNQRLLELRENTTISDMSNVVVSYTNFASSNIKNGAFLIPDKMDILNNPIYFNGLNYNINFSDVRFGVRESTEMNKNTSNAFIYASIKENTTTRITFSRCIFLNCGKIASFMSSGITMQNCFAYDNYNGIDIYENKNCNDIFENITFANILSNPNGVSQYGFYLNAECEVSNIIFKNVKNPFIVSKTTNLTMESVDVEWNESYEPENDKENVYCINFLYPDRFDPMNLPLTVANSTFACTESIPGLIANFTNYKHVICSNSKNNFKSVTHYPLPDTLAEVMQIRTDESPKIMTRYSEYEPEDSSMGLVRYRPYWGVNQYVTDPNNTFTKANITSPLASDIELTSQLVTFDYECENANGEIDIISKECRCYYVKPVPANTEVVSDNDFNIDTISKTGLFHVCFCTYSSGGDHKNVQVNITGKSLTDDSPLDITVYDTEYNTKVIGKLADGRNRGYRYDYIFRVNTDNIELDDKFVINVKMTYSSEYGAAFGFSQITLTEIDSAYCLIHNFEDVNTIIKDFCLPSISTTLLSEDNSTIQNVNFVDVNNANTSGFLSKNISLTTHEALKTISSIPWIYHAPYFKNNPINFNIDERSEVKIKPIPNGINVTRNGSAIVAGVDLIDFTHQFNYDTRFYFNAEVETNGKEEYDGSIMLYIDNILHDSWTPNEVYKKSFLVSSGFHSVKLFVPLAYNDMTLDLDMNIKNFFITESPDEEIYSVDVAPNKFYKLPLYKNGYIAITPISDNQPSFIRGQVDVVYASNKNTVSSVVDVMVEDIVIGNATLTREEFGEDVKGMNVDMNSPILPAISIIPANVTDPTISWKSNLPAVVSVINGYITGLSAGIATLTATCGNINKSIFVNSQIFPVKVEIDGFPSNDELNYGESFQLNLTVTPSDCTVNVTPIFESTDESVLTVTETGLVTCVGPGSAKIKVKLTDTDINCRVVSTETPEIAGIVKIDSITATKNTSSDWEPFSNNVINQNTTGIIDVSLYPEDTTDSKDITATVIATSGTARISNIEILDKQVSFATSGGGWIKIRIASTVRPTVYTDFVLFSRIPATAVQVLFNGSSDVPLLNYTDTLNVEYSLLPTNTTDIAASYAANLLGMGTSYINMTEIDADSRVIIATQPGTVTHSVALDSYSYYNRDIDGNLALNLIYNNGNDTVTKTTNKITFNAFIETLGLRLESSSFNEYNTFGNRGQSAILYVDYTPSFCTEFNISDLNIETANSDVVSIVYGSNNAFIVTAMENGNTRIKVSYCGPISKNTLYASIDVTVNVTDNNYNAELFETEVASISEELNSLNDAAEEQGISTFDMVFMGGLFAQETDVGLVSHNSRSISHVSNVLEISKRLTNSLDMLVFGGDAINTMSESTYMTEVWNTENVGPGPIFEKIRPRWSYLVGHTDRNDAYYKSSNMIGHTISLENLYSERYINNNATVDSGYGYWYKDNTEQKVRVIGINAHDRIDWTASDPYTYNDDYYRGFSRDQVEWFVNTALKTTPSDYTVFVVSPFGLHKSTAPGYTISKASNDYFNADVMINAINAFKNNGSFSVVGSEYSRSDQFSRYSLNDMTQNFADSGNGKIAVLSSGVGYDFSITIGGVNHITTEWSLGYNMSVDDAIALNTTLVEMRDMGYIVSGTYNNPRINEDSSDLNTVSEDSFDILHYESGSNEFTLVRFGAGSNRKFTFTGGITELIPCEDITLNITHVEFTDSESTETIIASPTPSNTTDAIIWSSNDASVATVKNGVITPVANGSCEISARCGEFVAVCSVNVSGIVQSIPCQGITLNRTSIGFTDLDTTVTITANVSPIGTTDEKVWLTSNENVATVEDGVVTPISDGDAVITCVCGGLSASCQVTISVVRPCESITLNKEALLFETYMQQSIIASPEPSNTTDSVVWESSNTLIATAEDGVITPIINGTCTITAICGKQLATCNVVVDVPVDCTGITLSVEQYTFVTNEPLQITATVLPENTSYDVIWESGMESVATVENGLVTPVGNGTCEIKATCGDQIAKCIVIVEIDSSLTETISE